MLQFCSELIFSCPTGCWTSLIVFPLGELAAAASRRVLWLCLRATSTERHTEIVRPLDSDEKADRSCLFRCGAHSSARPRHARTGSSSSNKRNGLSGNSSPSSSTRSGSRSLKQSGLQIVRWPKTSSTVSRLGNWRICASIHFCPRPFFRTCLVSLL